MTPDAVVQMQRVVGNRAMTQMLQRKVATETLDYTADETDGVTYLKAVIGAASKWGRGSKAQAGQPSRIDEVGSPLKTRYVGGHMLNQEVGGDGTWDNMIVQSHTSNTNMNLHDNIIKRLGDEADRLEFRSTHRPDRDYEYWVKEEIDVNAANPNGAHNFPAERHIPASLDVTLTPRKRHKTTKKESAWTNHGETINNPYHVVNVPPYPRAPHIAAPRRLSPKQMASKRLRLFKSHKGKNAYTLTQNQLKLVKGIGPVSATALYNFLQANNIPLLTLYNQNFTGLGFKKLHVRLLIAAGLK
jgi:hypothetical protein